MTTINVYLTFSGECEEAFEFYRSVFGGKYSGISRFSEMPAGGGPPIPEAEKDRIMHVSLPISKETVLMGSDTITGMGPEIKVGNNFSISVNLDSQEEAQRIFEKLSEGGAVTMPLEKTFWASLFGMATDRFGINWMVSCE